MRDLSPGGTRLWRWLSLQTRTYRHLRNSLRTAEGIELVPVHHASTNEITHDREHIARPHRSLSSLKLSTHQDSRRRWVRGVLICTYAAFGILLVNVILTIVAAAVAVARHDQRTMSSATIYKGSCDRTKAWTTGLHLLINVLSTIVLGASSYCMQCLTSPSRIDVDRAHGQRVWLDIGVASVRNLAWADWPRRTLWLVLLVTSLPIHLIYNSAVFFALGTREYEVVLASANFDFDRPPAHYNSSFEECFESNTAMSMSTFYADLPSFDNLTREECIRRYAMDFPTDLGTLILVTSNLTAANDHLQWVGLGSSVDYEGLIKSSYDWLCDQFSALSSSCTPSELLSVLDQWAASPLVPWAGPVINATVELPNYSTTLTGKDTFVLVPDTDDRCPNLTRDLQTLAVELERFPPKHVLQQYLDNSTNWLNSTWAQAVSLVPAADEVACAPDIRSGQDEGPEYPVEYCLSRKLTEQCELQFSPAICLVVILCNMIKVLCMLLTARRDRTDIFLTVGDAVASFLTHPDPSTERMGLVSRSNLFQGPQPWRSIWRGYLQVAVKDASRPQAWATLPPRQRWMRALHPSQWIVTIGVCLALLGVGGYYLSQAIYGLQNEEHPWTLRALWQLGFGSATPYTIAFTPNSSTVISVSLLANTPQIIISVGYFLYNNLLTHMLLAAEYDDYASQRKPLRVSWPQGSQRSSYYLSLPYRYSIPLMVASMLLHWLVSASLFYVQINAIDTMGDTGYAAQLIACGYGPIAIVFALILGGVMTCTVVGLGMRRFASHMPIAGSCSAAISAACHPSGGEEHALKPIIWGATSMAAVQPKGGADTDETISDHDLEDRGEPEIGGYSPLSSESTGQDGSYGHCSFTSEEVIDPDPSRLYI
ncbi:hypothetical protein AnigIFM49718_002657 [Aspergillus niger]|nr:hypothetical protein AnigIFM49718_002657 [Aspergillus niger]